MLEGGILGMKIDEHLIKLSAGKIPIDHELKIGEEVGVFVKGTVVKIEDTDNNDGTINRTYIVKGEIAE